MPDTKPRKRPSAAPRRTDASAAAGAPAAAAGAGLDAGERRFRLRAGLLFGALAALRILATFFPADRLWGLNHLAFLPLWLAGVLALLSLALCTPAAHGALRRAAPRLFGDGARALPVLAAILLCAAAAFWFLRMRTYFLGDGAVYLAEIFRYVRGIPGSFDVLYSKGSAPVTGWLLAQTAKLAFGASSSAEGLLANPQFAFWALGGLAGLGYVWTAWRASSEFGRGAVERAALLLLFCFGAGTLFFFGYVEYYTFYYAAMAAHLYATLRALEGKGGLLPAALLLALATAFHFMAVVAWPGFALAVLAVRGGEALRARIRPRALLLAAGALLLAAGVWYTASGVAVHGSRTVLSLVPFGKPGAMQSYTLLSSYHLVDIANYLLLLAAPALLAIALLARRESFRSPSVLVMLTYALFFLFLAVFGNLGFGMARDWDIDAALGLAVLFLLVALLRRAPASPRAGFVLALAAGSALAGGGAWLAANIIPEASVERYKAIIALDERHITGDYALNGYEHLRKYYASTGDGRGLLWAIGKKLDCVGYPDDYRKYTNAVLATVPPDAQQAAFDGLFRRLFERIRALDAAGSDSSYAGSRDEYRELVAENILSYHAAHYRDPQRTGFLKGVFAEAAALSPGDPVLAMIPAQMAWDQTGAVADPEPFARGGAAVVSSSMLSLYAGRALVFVKDYPRAAPLLEKSLRLDPAFTLPELYLAVSELGISPANAPRAARRLERFLASPQGRRLSSDPGNERRLVAYAEQLLAQIRASEAGAGPATP